MPYYRSRLVVWELIPTYRNVRTANVCYLANDADWLCASWNESNITCSRRGASTIDWSSLLITLTKKKPSGGKRCGQMKQKLSCLATTIGNIFGWRGGGSILLWGLFCCQRICGSKETKWNNKGGLSSDSSGTLKIISQKIGSWVQSVVPIEQ